MKINLRERQTDNRYREREREKALDRQADAGLGKTKNHRLEPPFRERAVRRVSAKQRAGVLSRPEEGGRALSRGDQATDRLPPTDLSVQSCTNVTPREVLHRQ